MTPWADRAALAGALLISAPLLHAQTATDFKGVELNSSVAALGKTIPMPECLSTPGGAVGDLNCILLNVKTCSALAAPPTGSPARDCPEKMREFHNIAGTQAKSMIFHYYNDRLATIHITLPRQSTNRIIDALKVKFGDPTEVESKTLQSGAGATFESQTHIWVRPDGEVRFDEFGSKVTESRLSYRAQWAMAEFMKRRQAETVKDAGKL